MNKHAFLITSAVNTKFGVFSSDQRLQQTLATVSSIRRAVPEAKIILVEMAAIALSEAQRLALAPTVDQIIDFTADHSVQELYHSTNNWDIVKNVNEVTCFARALRTLTASSELDGVQRIFKVSGRYTLTADFDISYYNRYENQNMIVLSRARPSHFGAQVTGGITQQFMSRLWSWPTALNTEIIEAYDQFLLYMFQRLQAGGYADIEHTLYKFLDHDKIRQLDRVGITGHIGPNGVAVED